MSLLVQLYLHAANLHEDTTEETYPPTNQIDITRARYMEAVRVSQLAKRSPDSTAFQRYRSF
ncbi:hypothetical protein K0M31_016902 [Melipona bicolor]|uniref:Uncharacterized protein n=1 Tax=Melipona bicolor TaxID=60889 RepID=A0AA40FE78_9HYME|nr:hypothetical protein K0M31_016902 [Melipona bicolor]